MATGGQRDVEVETHLSRTPTSEAWYRTKNEQTFLVSEEFTNASTGETAALLLRNPADSEMSAVVAKPVGNPAVLSYLRVHDAFTEDTITGTSVDVENNLLDASGESFFDPGVLEVLREPTYTAENTYYSEVAGEGVGATAGSGRGSVFPFILEPGRRVVIEVEKLNSGNNQVAITAEWFERSGLFSTEAPDPGPDEVTR